MDSFLRRVVAERELEQEAAIIATPVESLIPSDCRICGGPINMMDGAPLTVCSKCGGRKKQRRLEAQEQEQAAAVSRRRALLSFAGIRIREREIMADCPKCSKPLRSNNTRGVCTNCYNEGHRADGSEAPPSGDQKKKRPAKDVVKKFMVVAAALDLDPEQMISDFCLGWLEGLSSRVQPRDLDRVES